MKAQTPAVGILKSNDWGDMMTYKVVCNCGQPDHDHNICIEADLTGVTVQTYVTVKSDFWSEAVKPRYDINNTWLQEFDWFWKGLVNGLATRVKLTWTLWTKGYVQYESVISMDKQQALNYAETLKAAIKDVETFQKP